MPERPHMAFPVRLASHGGALAVNDQDSDGEVASCIAVILSWPRGARRGKPDFGVPTLDFEAVHLDEIREAITASEPRARALRDELLDEAITRGIAPVLVEFDQAGG